MAIVRTTNPVDDSEIVLAKGKVEQISIKEMETADKFQNTHKAGVRIGDDWVNQISLKVKEGKEPEIRFNAGNNAKPDWVTLEVGDEVSVIVTENEYNGKTYYNSGTSKIKLLKKGGGSAKSNTSDGKKDFKPRDNTGVEVGHAVNGALNLSRNGYVEYTTEGVTEVAEKVHQLTLKLKKEFAEKNPEMSEYDVGAMVGHAVLNGTRDSENFDDVEGHARFILEEVVPAVVTTVKASKEVAKPKAPAKPAAPKKPAPKPAPKKPDPEPEQQAENVPETSQEVDPYDDDDIPF